MTAGGEGLAVMRGLSPMQGRRWIGPSLLAWGGVWAFWLAATRRSHPSLALAVIVTTALVAAYAIAAYVNHLVLIPRFWRPGRRGGYAARLAIVMASLTAAALFVIRVAYRRLVGPDPDPNGVYKHFAVDLIGMVVHLAVVVVVVRLATGATNGAIQRTRPTGR
jgi:hypothetical protein